MNWETTYLNQNPWGNTFPTDFLDTIIPSLKRGARILDVGCGDGRNSIYLAELGFIVDAFDISSTAIKRLKSYLKNKNNLQLRVWIGDIRNELVEYEYDLIILYGVINSLKSLEWKSLIQKIKSITIEGGYNAIICFNNFSSKNSKDNYHIKSLTNPNEIAAYYHNWKEIKYDVRTTTHQHENRPLHQHVTERYIYKYVELGDQPISPPFSIAVIGPSHPITKATPPSYDPKMLSLYARDTGKFIAKSGNRLVCIPDGGVAKSAFNAYSAIKNMKPALILKPDHDDTLSKQHDSSWINNLKYNYELIDGLSWCEQPIKLVNIADIYIAIGLSCGTIIEIAWTKQFAKPVYMSLDLCSKIPPEILASLSVFELPSFEIMLKTICINLFKK